MQPGEKTSCQLQCSNIQSLNLTYPEFWACVMELYTIGLSLTDRKLRTEFPVIYINVAGSYYINIINNSMVTINNRTPSIYNMNESVFWLKKQT
jgi:hypothetical protein